MAKAPGLQLSDQGNTLAQLLFFEKGAMSFHKKEIPPDILQQILAAATSCYWLGNWKLLSIIDMQTRVRVVSRWQESLSKIGQTKGADFIERWKAAPLFVAFCQTKKLEPFQFVPPELVRTFSIQEVGSAVRSLELMALTFGIGLHGIMGVLIPEIGEPIKEVLKIPEDHEIVYFGIIGYPSEEALQKFPPLQEVCYSDAWGNPIRSESS